MLKAEQYGHLLLVVFEAVTKKVLSSAFVGARLPGGYQVKCNR